MERLFDIDDVLEGFFEYLLPHDFVRLSEVARWLRSRALSDSLWKSNKFLPLASTAFSGVPAYLVVSYQWLEVARN